jgi:myo-inositol-1(or 4)-monophosphatase
MITKDEKPNIEHLETLVLDACLNAGHYIRENALNITDLKWKKTDDPVTELDKNAEQMIRKQIGSKLHANFYGEEYGIDNQNADISIYIDPIDGTKSFVRGEYLSSVSIAAEYNNELVVGAVYDFMRDILYYANPEGAYVQQGNTSHISEPHVKKRMPFINMQLSKPTISLSHNKDKYADYVEEKIGRIQRRRPIGSMALSMAQLAAGSYDGLIFQPYKKDGITDACDIAAGYFIMKQAGIQIKDYALRKYDYKEPSKGIIALTPALADKINHASSSRLLGPLVKIIKDHKDQDDQIHHTGEEALLIHGYYDKDANEVGAIYCNSGKSWPHHMINRTYFQFIHPHEEEWWNRIYSNK